MVHFQFILLLLVIPVHDLKVLDTSHQLSRHKRFLVWKEGINWVALIFGIGIPFELNQESVTIGMVMKAYYQLPNNSTLYTNPEMDSSRRTRSITRWDVYHLFEQILQKHYSDGKACLLKSICQVSSVKLEERSGLLAELVHHFLTPSSTIEEHTNEYHEAELIGRETSQCHHFYPDCPKDPIEQFSRFMTLEKYMY